MKVIAIISLSTILFSGCVTSELTSLDPSLSPEEDKFEVYFTTLPSRSYNELLYIETTASMVLRKKHAYRKLVATAKANNADALINVKLSYTRFLWALYPTAEGIAIKYKVAQSEQK